eukprot:4939323-Prymnesium_polylepis.1
MRSKSCEERARAPRTAVWGRVGRAGLGWSAAWPGGSDGCMKLLRRPSRVTRRMLPARSARCRCAPRAE